MEILKRLPDDIIELIHYELHKNYMVDVKNQLKLKIDERWNRMTDDNKYDYINKYYKTKYISYCIFDDSERLINPENVAFYGNYRIVEQYDDESQVYVSDLITDPTYLDILMETDKIPPITGDFHHIFLEGVQICNKINDDYYLLSVFLGS